jgi:hypothetical protein
MFDPSDLSLQLTRESVLELLRPAAGSGEAPNLGLALMGALRLGEPDLTRETYLAVRRARPRAGRAAPQSDSSVALRPASTGVIMTCRP